MTTTKSFKSDKTRNVIVIAMMKRHGSTTTVMKDRRIGRGGSKNKAREFLSGNY
jgi:hypothetical protein